MRKEFSDDELAETEAEILNLSIPTSGIIELQSELNKLLSSGARARRVAQIGQRGAPRGYRLIGTQGLGKTSALLDFVGCGAAGGIGRNGAAYVPLPSHCTGNAIAGEILRCLGEQNHGRFSKRTKPLDRIDLALKSSSPVCTLLILDNVSNCYDADTGETVMGATRSIRSIIDRCGIPVVLAGSGRLHDVLRADSDLDAKTPYRLPLSIIDVDTAKGLVDLQNVMSAYMGKLPALTDSYDLTDGNLLLAIHDATDGLFGKMSTLTATAALRAMRRKDGPLAITWDDWDWAYDRCICGEINPFRDKDLRAAVKPQNDASPSQRLRLKAVS
jgi:hypothetical protein